MNSIAPCAALFEVLTGNLTNLAYKHHPVPFGPLLLLAGLPITPTLGGRQTDGGHRPPLCHLPHLRLLAKMADQNYFDTEPLLIIFTFFFKFHKVTSWYSITVTIQMNKGNTRQIRQPVVVHQTRSAVA